MQLTRAADYAARVMIHLAGMPADSRASRSELAAAAEVPKPFLGKILQSLVRSGLIHSQRGVSGGFTLGRPPSEVTLLHVIEAVEGPLFLNRCLNPGEGCHRSSWCAAHQLWVEAQAAMGAVLGRASILDLAMRSATLAQPGETPEVCVLDKTVTAENPRGLTAWN
jgi:Rrf2 family protein